MKEEKKNHVTDGMYSISHPSLTWCIDCGKELPATDTSNCNPPMTPNKTTGK